VKHKGERQEGPSPDRTESEGEAEIKGDREKVGFIAVEVDCLGRKKRPS